MRWSQGLAAGAAVVVCSLAVAATEPAASEALPAVPEVACSPERPGVPLGGAVRVRAWASSPTPGPMRHAWTPEAGEMAGRTRPDGRSSEVLWDLAGAEPPGPYRAHVEVTDGEGAFATCGVSVLVLGSSRAGERATGRSFLWRGDLEESGYGLYSYLLFARPPGPEDLPRFLAATEVYLRFLPEITAMEELLEDRSRLNVTYLPLRVEGVDGLEERTAWLEETLPDLAALRVAGDLSQPAREVLESYDFERAAILLGRLEGSHPRGPYLISTERPLSDPARLSDRYLFQDLSAVPPELVPAWIEAFLGQVSQTRYWEEGSIERLRRKMRLTVSVLADAVPDVLEGLRFWVRLLTTRELVP